MSEIETNRLNDDGDDHHDDADTIDTSDKNHTDDKNGTNDKNAGEPQEQQAESAGPTAGAVLSQKRSSSNGESKDKKEPREPEPEAALALAPPPPRRPPKRARTAYFIFAEFVRGDIQQEFPGETVATQAKRIGARWQAIESTEKDRFKALAASEKEKAAIQLRAYKEHYGKNNNNKDAADGGSSSSAALDGNNNNNNNTDDDLVFPVARIRKIAKLDPEVKTLSKEALQLVVKCTELVTAKLGLESAKVASLQNRRTLMGDDLSHVCAHQHAFRFLKDDIKDLTRAQKAAKQQEKIHNNNNNGTTGGGSKKEAAAAAGTKPLTSYFGAVASKKQTNK